MSLNKAFVNRYGQVRSGWKILSVILLVMIISMIVSLIVGIMPISRDVKNVIAMYAGQVVFVIAVWIALKWIDRKHFKDIGLGSFRFGDFLSGLLLGAVLMTLIFFILLASGEVTLQNALSDPNISHFIWSGLLLFILVGFTEELVFRGYFMTVLGQMDRKWLTVVISALIFAFVHGNNPNASLLGITNVFIVGVLFAVMFIKTGSLWMPIGFHIAWNYFQGNVFGFPVSGTEPNGIYNIGEMGSALWTGGAFGPEGGLLATLLLGVGFLFVWWYPAGSDEKERIFSHSE